MGLPETVPGAMYGQVCTSYLSLTFDCNILFLLHGRFGFFLGNQHLQGAVLEFGLDVLLGHCVTYIEASAAGTGITLSADVGSV